MLQINIECGLKPISQPTMSRIWKEHFNNVAIKPVGGLFTKCTECDMLQQYISRVPRGSPQYVLFVNQRIHYLQHQASCRRIYHSWREKSKCNKGEILCIIHDKMDTAKTTIPCMHVTTKLTTSLGQFLVNVIRMVTHGHGDGAYVHYSTDLWPRDLNFTISSLARLLRQLEQQPT